MGALDEARRRTGRFLREREGLIDKAAGRLRSAASDVLERTGKRGGADRAGTPARTPSAPPAKPRQSTPPPRRGSSAGGPSMSRVREQADRLGSGIARVGGESEVEQLVSQNTKAELMRRAHELEVKGRSRMSKRELAEEIASRR